MMMTMMRIIITVIITTASYCLIKQSLGSGVAVGVASGLLTHFFFSSPPQTSLSNSQQESVL